MQKLSIFILVFMASLLAGCGGSGIQQSDDGSRGDGSIPIGRVIGSTRGITSVKMTFSDGSVRTATTEPNGLVMVEAAPSGMATIEVLAGDPDLLDATYNTMIGENKNQIFNIRLQKADRQADVDSVEFKNASPLRLRIGDKVKLKTKLKGKKIGGLEPSLILSGGEGMIDATDHFTALATGSGTITAEIFGKTATLQVVVEP